MEPKRVILSIFSHDRVPPDRVRQMGAAALRNPLNAKRRSNEARDLSYFAGRAALASALRHLGRTAWVEPEPEFGYLIAVDRAGNPQPDLFFNISHTRQIAVAVVGTSSVGVDVESLTRNASVAIRRVATKSELDGWFGKRFQVEGQSLPGELALWSAKEAVSKAVGLGIKFGMHHFVIGLTSGPPPYAVRLGISGPLSVADPAVRFHRHEEFLIALCSEKWLLEAPPEILVLTADRE